METSKLILAICRALQILFAAVVLGVSAQQATKLDNLKDLCNAFYGEESETCDLKGLVPAVRFCAFVGAWGLIDALVGIAGIFFNVIPWIVNAGIDGLAALFYLAGGIRLAVLLNELQCNGSACSKIEADAAFLFLGFLVTLALIGMGFFWQRGSGKLHSAV